MVQCKGVRNLAADFTDDWLEDFSSRTRLHYEIEPLRSSK
jgi:hypothetical protein